ncbi:hypothetical protein KUL42_21890 [Alteromonas sp. KUL42]|nr:hypothetical protein KUL42_21890 [Alteromonas sp. KUL42]
MGWETASGRYELVSSEISILSMHKGVLSVEATPLLNLLNPVSNQTTNLQSRALLADTGFSHKTVDFTICADKSYFPVSDVYSLHAEYIKSISSQPVKGLKRLTLLSEHIFLPSLSFELLPAAFVSQSLLFLAKQSSMVRVRYPSHKGSFADILNSL